MKKFVIWCQYECWGKNGKEWGPWFVVDSKPRGLEDATKKKSEFEANSKRITKITKLQSRYKIEEWKDNTPKTTKLKRKTKTKL